MRDQRAEIKQLQAIERAENKEEARKRVEAEIAAKKQRRHQRDVARIERANRRLTTSVNKHMARARATKERQQQKARKRLDNAQKYGRSTIVHFGEKDENGQQSLKLTMYIAPPKPKKPSAAPKLPQRSGYAIYNLTCEQHEKLDKYCIQTPIQQPDPYKRLKMAVTPTSNGARATRSSAAVNERREAEAKRKREE